MLITYPGELCLSRWSSRPRIAILIFSFFRVTAFRTARLETFRCCGHLIDHVLDRPPERFVLNELALGAQLIRADVGADTYDFSHALIRHTLCAELWQATIGERCWSLLRVKVVSHRPTARAACSYSRPNGS